MGRPFYPWQRYVVDVGLEVLDDGSWAYDEVIVEVERRSGKSVLISPIAAHRSGRAVDPDSTWITAQKRKAAVRRWADAAGPIRKLFPAGALRYIISNDHETLQWVESGREFVPFAPDATTMHGEEPGLVFVDELWAFSTTDRDEIQAGYRPAWSVRSGQEWKLSAAGTLDSGWLKADRERGRRAVEDGQTRGIAYFRWCVPDEIGGIPTRKLPDAVLLEAIMANHPRRDHGLKRDYVASEIERDRDDALRAYGGLDNNAAAEGTPIDLGRFRAARATAGETTIPAEAGRLAVGLGVDPSSREASISVGWESPDGATVVEAVATRPGTLWLAGAVRSIVEAFDVAVVVVGPDGREVGDELSRMERADGTPLLAPAGEYGGLLRVTAGDWLAACRRFRDRIEQQQPDAPRLWIHDERETEPILGAVRASDVRQYKAGFEWVAKAIDVPISALPAATAAAWGADHTPAPPAPRVPLVIH